MLWRGEGVTPTPPPVWDNTYSLDFDGVDDTIDVGTASLGITTAISVSAWVKTTATGVIRIIVAEDDTGSDRNWLLFLGSNNKIGWYLYNTDDTLVGLYRAAANEITDGDWHHVLGTYDGTSDADGIKLYVDGNVETATAGSTGIRSAASVEPAIGSKTAGANWFWSGNIDEVSVFDSVKVVADVSDGTKPIDLTGESNLVAWWRMGDSGTFFNSNWEIPEYTKIDNWSSHSMEFDGVDDYIDLGTDSSLEPASALSVSAWVKRDASLVNYSGIVQSQKDTNNDGWAMVGTSANKVRFYLWATLGMAYAEIDSAITIDTWYHILGTWDGSTIRLYVNGVLQSTTGSAADIDYPTTPNENAKIGQYALAEFSGNIDDVSIYSTDKSSSASAIYNSGVPTDLSAESGLVGYWRMGEDATFSTNWTIPDASINSNDGTSSGMAIEDKVNNAPDNINQGLSSGMVEGDRVTDVP